MYNDWIDVSVPLDDGVIVWPGDPEFQRELLSTTAVDGVEVSQLRMSVHTGTHVDAPAHYLEGGATIGTMPIDAMVGPCVVLQIPEDVIRIDVEHLEAVDLAEGERVLLRTGNSTRGLLGRRSFVEDYTFLTPDAAAYLARLPARCVGIDYLSVGGPGPEGVETHELLLASGVWIIECLELAHVAPGTYDLVCLPLRLMSAEGAPARAILQKLGGRKEDEIDFIDDALEWATKTG